MAGYSCPNGHTSTKPDYCSDCGVKIEGNAPSVYGGTDRHTAATINITLPKTEPCPDCGVPRSPDLADCCEICGYNFVTGAHGEIPAVPSRQAGSPMNDSTRIISPALAAETLAFAWSLTVCVDPALRAPESPDPPVGIKPRALSLKKTVNLIGRSSESRGVLPEIPLNYDDAVSHRHATVTCAPKGGLVLRDIGSANGTRLNGADVKPMEDLPLHDGDVITLGHWTRITVHAAKKT